MYSTLLMFIKQGTYYVKKIAFICHVMYGLKCYRDDSSAVGLLIVMIFSLMG